jgi:RNA polymerase sigma factor (TIGR02999 family)
MERLYPDLRDLAGRHAWRMDLEGSASDLAQELCLQLLQQQRTTWRNRGHFFAVAAKLARRLVSDRRRHDRRLKRGGRIEHVPLPDDLAAAEGDLDLLALDEALDRLARISPSAVRVVELRFFAGLEIDETAAALEVGRATVLRRWRFARAWLYDALKDAAVEQRSGAE